jgi:hypothetical protein
VFVGDVSLECHLVLVAVESQALGDGAVDTVRADHRGCLDPLAIHGQRRELHAHAVPELGAGLARLIDEVGVEPAALRHGDQRPRGSALEALPVAEAELEDVHLLLDDRVDREGE